MVWHDMMWCDVMWRDVMWCNVMWCDVIWYDMIWYDMIWYDMIWYDMIWYDIYDMIWYSCNTNVGCVIWKGHMIGLKDYFQWNLVFQVSTEDNNPNKHVFSEVEKVGHEFVNSFRNTGYRRRAWHNWRYQSQQCREAFTCRFAWLLKCLV